MTTEMFRIILRLALTHLARLSPEALAQEAPWLTRAQVRWCTAHVHQLAWDDDEFLRAKQFLCEAVEYMKHERHL